MEKKNPKVIVIANQKGGVGKTTTALALQSMYKLAGLKSLFIDFEIQGNGTIVHRAKTDDVETAYNVFVEPISKENPTRTNINHAIQHTEYGDIISNHELLASADTFLGKATDAFNVKNAIANLEGYDVVIIDTQPALNALLIASLIAATHVIVPFPTEVFSLHGLSQLNKTITDVKSTLNPNVVIEGILVTRVIGKETRFRKDMLDCLEQASNIMNTKVFETFIRETTALKESQFYEESLFEYSKGSNTAKDYMNFFKELEGIDLFTTPSATQFEKSMTNTLSITGENE